MIPDPSPVNVLVFILLLIFPGLPIVTLLLRRFLSLLQLVATGVGLSLTLNGVALFYLGLLNRAEPADLLLATIVVTMIGCGLAYRYRHETTQLTGRTPTTGMFVPVLLCSICLGVILSLYAVHSFSMPFTEWDAILIYNQWAVKFWKTRVLVPMGDYGVYPQGLGADYAWLYILIGAPNEHFAHLLTPIFGIIAIIFTWALAEELGLPAWLAAFLLIIVPEFGYNLHSGFSELPAAALAMGSIFLLVKAQGLGSSSSSFKRVLLLLSGIMMGGAAWFRISAMILVAGVVFYVVWDCWASRKPIVSTILPVGIGLLIMAHWQVWIMYSQGLQPFMTLGHNLMSNAIWWGYPNPSLFDRAARSVQTTITSGDPIILMALLWGALLNFLWPGSARRLTASLFAPMWLMWSLTLSYDLRYMMVVLPLASVLAAKPVWNLLKDGLKLVGNVRFGSLNLRRILPLFLLLLAIPVSWGPILQAVKGPGPDQTWSLTHLAASDEEKRLAVLGDMYEAVLYVQSNRTLRSAHIVTPDTRIPVFLENANYSWPMSLDNLRGYDYLILGAWAFRNNGWNRSILAELIQNRDPRLVMVASFGWDQNYGTDYNGYAIFQIKT